MFWSHQMLNAKHDDSFYRGWLVQYLAIVIRDLSLKTLELNLLESFVSDSFDQAMMIILNQHEGQ